MSSSGTLTTLYSFCSQGCDGGNSRSSTLLQAANGNLYGTTLSSGYYDCGSVGCGAVFELAVTPALPAPVQVSLSSSQVQPGASVTASLKVLNAFSLTMQQCYAFQTLNGATTPLGKVPGTYNSSTSLYTFSGTIPAPSKAGIYTYAVTCGGVESGFATLTSATPPQPP